MALDCDDENDTTYGTRACYTVGSLGSAPGGGSPKRRQLAYDDREGRPVKPAPFTYHRPETLTEAVRLLAEVAPQDGRVLAVGEVTEKIQTKLQEVEFKFGKCLGIVQIRYVEGPPKRK